jgi:Ion channel
MISTLLVAWALVVITVSTHAAGLTVLIKVLLKPMADPPSRFWAITRLLVKVTWYLILIHLADVMVWGLFYWWQDCLPDAESAFYFSGVTYTTTGYGELVLKEPWRVLAPIEALTGILMCGLSAGFFFALVSRIFTQHPEMADRIEARSK